MIRRKSNKKRSLSIRCVCVCVCVCLNEHECQYLKISGNLGRVILLPFFFSYGSNYVIALKNKWYIQNKYCQTNLVAFEGELGFSVFLAS